MVRVGIILIANTIYVRKIPRIHSQFIIQLIKSQLIHFFRFPILDSPLLREGDPFKILGDINIGQNLENIASLVTVVNPVLVCPHTKPKRIVLNNIHRTRIPVAIRRKHNRGFPDSIHRRVTRQIRNHGMQNVFYILQTAFVANAISGSFFFGTQDKFIEGVKRISIDIRPARILFRFPKGAILPSKPAAPKHADPMSSIHIALGIFCPIGRKIFFNSIAQIGSILSSIQKSDCRKTHFVMELIIAIIGRRIPASRLGIVRGGISQSKFPSKFIHLFRNHQTTIRKVLVIFRIMHAQQG